MGAIHAGVIMHSDHAIFEHGVSQSRKVQLTFFSSDLGREFVSLCAPLYYSRGRDETDESEWYYFWDFDAEQGHNFIALSPHQIVAMTLTEDAFSMDEISSFSRGSETSTTDTDARPKR
jgi:hypothetical protein